MLITSCPVAQAPVVEDDSEHTMAAATSTTPSDAQLEDMSRSRFVAITSISSAVRYSPNDASGETHQPLTSRMALTSTST
jgi:hypothetical protein